MDVSEQESVAGHLRLHGWHSADLPAALYAENLQSRILEARMAICLRKIISHKVHRKSPFVLGVGRESFQSLLLFIILLKIDGCGRQGMSLEHTFLYSCPR